MNFDPVYNYLSSITSLSPHFKKALEADLKMEQYNAKQVIKADQHRENRLWFISEGFARNYYLDENGNDHTLHFWKSEELIFSFAGYWREPSPNTIEILEPSTLYSISYKQLDALLQSHPETFQILKNVVKHHYEHEYRWKRIYTLRAKDRYKHFRNESAIVFKKAPLWMIASYLNMSRETLNRLVTGKK